MSGRESIAHHEAGHFVIDLILGLTTYYLSIEEHGETDNRFWFLGGSLSYGRLIYG